MVSSEGACAAYYRYRRMEAAYMVDYTLSCPVPRVDNETVLLAHGSGGRAMHRLLESVFMPAFANAALASAHDGAALNINGARLAFTTDSYVVHPLFFPGGDIGALAVNGTVNDLAMCGARPLFLSAGFHHRRGPADGDASSASSNPCSRQRLNAAGVQIVTGDTKVVDKGKGDGLIHQHSGHWRHRTFRFRLRLRWCVPAML